MPQQKINTHGLRINNLKEAAGKIRKIIAQNGRYAIFYSWITGDLHVIEPFLEYDPDWILVIEETPYLCTQQELADKTFDAVENMKKKLNF